MMKMLRNFWRSQIAYSPNDGAGAGTPSSEPSPSPAASPSPSTDSSSSPPSTAMHDAADDMLGNIPSADFSGLGIDHDAELADPETQKLTAPPVPAPAAQPATQVQPSAQAAPAPQPNPVATPQQPVAPTQAQAPAQPQPTTEPASTQSAQPLPHDLGALLTTFQQHEPTLIQAVAESEFKLTPEEIGELETNAEAAVPKLLAKNYVKTVKAVLHFMNNHMSAIVGDAVTRQSVHQEAHREFTSKFPSLNDPKFAPFITQVGQALRATYPQMSRSELIDRIGTTVMAMHGIASSPQQAGQQQQQRQVQPPFAPALSPARTMQPVAAALPNGNDFFAGLSQDYIE